MPEITVRQFADVLVDLSLASRGQAEALVASSGAGDDPRKLATALIASKHITAFQAEAILHGRAAVLRMGEYIILDRIGAGGMGAVYKAQHRMMHRVVALKVISQTHMTGSDTEAKSLKERFYREVQAAARLQHPNIVAAHDAGEIGKTPYLAMEFVRGLDLSKLIKDHGPLPWRKAVDLVLQTAAGLKYAHDMGIVHRDIKPANLLLNREGQVKILDMGLARITSEIEQETAAGLTTTGVGMGTAAYMSPEQARNAKAADHRTDIYALGCTLYYLMTARLPFTGESAVEILMAKLEKPPPRLDEHSLDVPETLQDVFAGMLARDVSERYQSMADVIADLQAVVAGETISRQDSAGAPVANELDMRIAQQIEAEVPTEGQLVRLETKPPPPPERSNRDRTQDDGHVERIGGGIGVGRKLLIGAVVVALVALGGFMLSSKQVATPREVKTSPSETNTSSPQVTAVVPEVKPLAPEAKAPEAKVPEAKVPQTTTPPPSAVEVASVTPAPTSRVIPAPASTPGTATALSPATTPAPDPTEADVAAVKKLFPIGNGEQVIVAENFDGPLGLLWNPKPHSTDMIVRDGRLVSPADHGGKGNQASRLFDPAVDLGGGTLRVYVRLRLPNHPRRQAEALMITLDSSSFLFSFGINAWVSATVSSLRPSVTLQHFSIREFGKRDDTPGAMLLKSVGSNWTNFQFVVEPTGNGGVMARILCLDERARKWLPVYATDRGEQRRPQKGPLARFNAPQGPITGLYIALHPIDAQGSIEIEAIAVTLAGAPAAATLTPVPVAVASTGGNEALPGGEWFVAPDGKPENAGTKDSPWDIESTLKGERGVKPGNTIWLVGGTYRHPDRHYAADNFTIALAGEAERPIHVRALPGERAILDGKVYFNSSTRHLWLRDVEITVSEWAALPQARRISNVNDSAENTFPEGGVRIAGGPGCRLINSIIRDTPGNCIYSPGEASDAEIYGCIVLRAGGVFRGEKGGVGIQMANIAGHKLIADNFVADCVSRGLTTTARTPLVGVRIEGNIITNSGHNGMAYHESSSVELLNNVFNNNETDVGRDTTTAEACRAEGNLSINASFEVKRFQKRIDQNNESIWVAKLPPNQRPAIVVLRPNKYDPDRAHVAIVNCQKRPVVVVQPGGFMKQGEKFRFMDPTDLWGKPVVEGIYNGKSVSVPVRGEFAAFVLFKDKP